MSAASPSGPASAASPSTYVGVDVGGTSTRAVAFDASFQLLTIESAPTPRGADAIAELAGALVDRVRQAPGPAGARSPVAVCMPGRVETHTGQVAAAVNLGIDAPVAMGALLAGTLGTDVHLENDVNAAALGAFHRMNLDPGSSLAYVNVGTGIAAGFVLGGRLWRGAGGGAGEIGHIPMRIDAPPCPCGQVGCAEAIGSGRAVGADPSRRDDVLAAVAWTVQLCVLTLDVQHVAIGGGLTEAGEPFLDALRGRLAALESGSLLLRSAGLLRRLHLAPAGAPLGALGAVLAMVADTGAAVPGRPVPGPATSADLDPLAPEAR